jgi:hypothetical protein
MIINNLKNILWISVLSAVLLSGISCDSILPDEFDDSKKYNPSQSDVQACTILSTSTVDSLGNLTTFFQPFQIRSLTDIVDTASVSGLTENQIILSRFNQMADSVSSLSLDAPLLVTYPTTLNDEQRFAYAKITSQQSRDVSIYVSLVYTSSNIDEFIGIQLIRSDTSVVSFSEDMVGETISECSQVINTRIVSTIRARYKLHLDQNVVYLVRFFINNPATIGPFKLLIMSI